MKRLKRAGKEQRGEDCITENVPDNLIFGEYVSPALAGQFFALK